MSILNELLEFNAQFVKNKQYEPFETTPFPDKRIVILSCMDTRLTELLPKALNLRNGDAKIIKNAGAVITDPFGSVIRSILVAVYKLNANQVYVIGHHGCGMIQMEPDEMLDKMISTGIKQETIATLNNAGIDLNSWLTGFNSVHESVKQTVLTIEQHPLFPKEIPVYGLVIDPGTGEVEQVT